MPTYQYTCTECGEPLEAVQSFTDAALTMCPRCGGRLRKVFSAVGVVFKGSGFYRTDSRSGAAAASADGGSGDAGTAKESAPASSPNGSGSGDKGSGGKASGDKGSSDKGSSDKASGGKAAPAPAPAGAPSGRSSSS